MTTIRPTTTTTATRARSSFALQAQRIAGWMIDHQNGQLEGFTDGEAWVTYLFDGRAIRVMFDPEELAVRIYVLDKQETLVGSVTLTSRAASYGVATTTIEALVAS